MPNQVKIVILAAGKGNRMQSELPKVLLKVNGESMIKRLLATVEKSGIDDKPAIVVGYKKDLVQGELGDGYNYVVQEEQLGTGHAVLRTYEFLKDKAKHVMVLYGDHPLVSAETMKNLADTHLRSGAKITMATIKLSDFKDSKTTFYNNFSRIIRKEGKIIKSVEVKDATEEEKKTTEVNPCYFCFEAKWLWSNLLSLNNQNTQHEFYLTDLVEIAIKEGEKLESISIDYREGLGANSKEELQTLEKFAI